MRADAFPVGVVLGDQKRFVVPIYQRHYAWNEDKRLRPFFTNIENKARERLEGKPTLFAHYMGALIVLPQGSFEVGRVPELMVVDGQQRLTTFQMFLAAIRDLASELNLDDMALQLRRYVLNGDEAAMKDPANARYKLQPTSFDRALFRDLIDRPLADIKTRCADRFYQNGSMRKGDTPLLLRAWWFFREEARDFAYADGADPLNVAHRLTALWRTVLEDFRVVMITLDEGDDAQVIFETLNSMGEPLNAMDLVRNDVFYRAARRGEDIEELMTSRWSTFEDWFWKKIDTQGRIKKPRIDFFLAHTLAAESGKEVSLSELYAEYRGFAREAKFPSVAAELDVLTRHAPTYRTLIEAAGASPLAQLARRLKIWDVTTAYPLVFVIAADQTASVEEKTALYKLVYGYIVRRAICGFTAKNYNNVFLRVAAHLRKSGSSVANFADAFANQTGETVRFPDDQEFERAILNRPVYGALPAARLNLVLEDLELAIRGKFDENVSLPPNLTIEHVLPDSWTANWSLPDGRKVPADGITGVDEAMRAAIEVRDILKHTLGNLTLITGPNNTRFSNLPFTASVMPPGGKPAPNKRDWLRESLLKLNQNIAAEAYWDETKIRERGQRLAKLARELWPAPQNPAPATSRLEVALR